jgi:hypothetical protein
MDLKEQLPLKNCDSRGLSFSAPFLVLNCKSTERHTRAFLPAGAVLSPESTTQSS